MRVGFVGSVVPSSCRRRLFRSSEPGNASRNFDRKLRSTLRALCAGDPDIRRTRANRHICPTVPVRESSFVRYRWTPSIRGLRRRYTQFRVRTVIERLRLCRNYRDVASRNHADLDFVARNTLRRHDRKTDSFRKRIVLVVYSDISCDRARSDHCFFFSQILRVERKEHQRMTLCSGVCWFRS